MPDDKRLTSLIGYCTYYTCKDLHSCIFTRKHWFYNEPHGFECTTENLILKLYIVGHPIAAFTGREIVLDELSVA